MSTTAQSSAGIKLYYGTGTVTHVDATSSVPEYDYCTVSTWTEIPDVTSIPSMQGDPNMLDTTTLAEKKQKTYTMGLADNGGSMQYGCWLTGELITAVDNAVSAYNGLASGSKFIFKIEFPAPLSKSYWYIGKPMEVLPGEAEVDGVLASNFNTSMESHPSVDFAARNAA